MKKFKSGNSYYLDKQTFSSVDADTLWSKLVEHVEKNISSANSVAFDADIKKATIMSNDVENLPDVVKLDNATMKLDMNLSRTISLNLKFDRQSKGVILDNDIPSSFQDGNTVKYNVRCRESDLQKSSLFFHESAMQNYAIDSSAREWATCADYLAIVKFIETSEENGNIVSSDVILVLDYDKNTEKLETNDTFELLNPGIDSAVLSGIIDHLNGPNKASQYDYPNENRSATEFKVAVSAFKLPGKDASTFIDFKSFVPSLIYKQFIDNLLNKL